MKQKKHEKESILGTIKNIFYPNGGKTVAFLVWFVFSVIVMLAQQAQLLSDPTKLAIVLVLNAIIFYVISCLSICAYEGYNCCE